MILRLAGVLADVPCHRVHQMGFAEPDSTIEKQRIERDCVRRADTSLGDVPGGGMGELVRLADDEILENEALIKRQVLRLVVADVDRRRGVRRQAAATE